MVSGFSTRPTSRRISASGLGPAPLDSMYVHFVSRAAAIKCTISLQIEEPLLPIETGTLSIYDAGDSVNLTFSVVHSSLTAYRVNLTVTYPTEYFYVNISDVDAVLLYKDGTVQSNSIDIQNGTFVFRTDSLAAFEVLVAVATLIVTNDVANAASYVVPHYLDWHNLPYGLEGGRNYNVSGEQIVPIKAFQLSMAYTTSDENTQGNMVQLQEYVSVNVTVTVPEVYIATQANLATCIHMLKYE